MTHGVRPQRFWASRPDRNNLDVFWEQLTFGRLRQGWGYEKEQNLELIFTEMQKGGEWWLRLTEKQNEAYRNYPFHPGWGEDTMHQGDIVLIPNMPTFGFFALARIEDDKYNFDIMPDQGDYGHWRSVKLLTPEGISNDNGEVVAPLQSTLKCRSRIWRIDGVGDCLNHLIDLVASGKLVVGAHFSSKERFDRIISKARDSVREPARTKAIEVVTSRLDEEFQAGGFEFAVKHILESQFLGATVEHLGGPEEVKHGTDLLIRIENPLDDVPLIIAVQVKMHQGESSDGIDQLEKAYYYWSGEGKYKGILVGLALINTGILTSEAMEKWCTLKAKVGLHCYLVDRKKVIELLSDVALNGI